MDSEVQKKLDEHTAQLNAIYQSVERTRKYFLAVLIISVVVFVLPLVGLLFAVPAFLNSYTNALGL